MAGFSISAVQSRLRRERNRVNGFQLRRRHGAVHKEDWCAYLNMLAEKKSGGQGAAIRKALEAIESEVA